MDMCKTGRVLACAAAVLTLAASAREADALRAALAAKTQTLSLGAGALSGCVLAAGGETVPLAFGRVGSVKAPVAAATVRGRGRAVAISHEAFLSPDRTDHQENVAFLRECLLWLAGGRKPSVIHVDVRHGSLHVLLEKAVTDVRIEPLANYDQLDKLPATAVVVTSPDGHSLVAADKLAAFLDRGGRALCTVVGWGWQQIHPNKSLRSDSPFNKVFGPAGLFTANVTVDPGKNGLFDVTKDADLPGLSADDALELTAEGASLPDALGARCLYTLGSLAEVLPLDDTRWLPKLTALAKSASTAFVPSPERPLGSTRVRERLAYQLFQDDWLSDPERVWPASPAAGVYPGVPAKGTKRETRDVSVDLSIPRWHGTGLFAAAGEPLTVTLPEGAEKLGLRVRVGSTTCRVTKAPHWRRAPVVDIELPLVKKETKFSSPFGGLVYLVVPAGAQGKVSVKVGPACPAAWFVEGRDTPETWLAALRSSPAPFVELENDHVVLSVPKTAVQNLADPRPLLQVWREITDHDARLAGIPTTRTSPERLVGDVQLCAGYMHAGYPIMIPTGCLRNLMSEKTIRTGKEDDVWGFFHEMGHNHQNPAWTFDGTTEVTVNFFTLYCMQKICGKSIRETKMGADSIARGVAAWNAAGRPPDKWFDDPFLALDFFAKLIEKYGWESFEKLFAEYQTCPPSELPKTDEEKRIQWCRRLSRIVGEDLSDEFKFLGVPPAPKEKSEILTRR